MSANDGECRICAVLAALEKSVGPPRNLPPLELGLIAGLNLGIDYGEVRGSDPLPRMCKLHAPFLSLTFTDELPHPSRRARTSRSARCVMKRSRVFRVSLVREVGAESEIEAESLVRSWVLSGALSFRVEELDTRAEDSTLALVRAMGELNAAISRAIAALAPAAERPPSFLKPSPDERPEPAKWVCANELCGAEVKDQFSRCPKCDYAVIRLADERPEPPLGRWICAAGMCAKRFVDRPKCCSRCGGPVVEAP